MISRNVATLVVLGSSSSASVEQVTKLLIGLEPTDWGEPGDTNVSAKRRHSRKDGRPREHAIWLPEIADDGSSGDETGFASLRALVLLLASKTDKLRVLEQDENYEIRVDWAGFSDSSQGGFVLEPDLATRLGELGIPLYGTAYLAEHDDQ